MGTQKDRMLPGKLSDQIPHLQNLLRIESYHRLIQDQHLRITNQRLSKPGTLLIAFGKISDQTPRHIFQLRSTHDLSHMNGPFLFGYLFQFSHKHQIFIYRHVRIQWRYFRQIADTLLGFLRLGQDIESIYPD